jgi:SAM-dependent methyltransferase
VLEIGSGPIGVVRYFAASERVAVDPLNDFYGSDPNLSALRTTDVQYVTGVGEELVRPDASVDLVIMENCIDHTRDVGQVLSEIERVLRPGGVLYLTVNCRSIVGFGVHRLLSTLSIDAGHPHTFTIGKLRRILDRPRLRTLSVQGDSLFEAWKADLTSSKNRDKLKAVLQVSEYLATAYVERAAK